MPKTYRHFIREMSEAVLSYKDYPLTQKFHHFNKTYFGSVIPDNTPVVWGKTPKHASGSTSASVEPAPGQRKPSGAMVSFTKMVGTLKNLKITMSTEVPERMEWKWDGILLHEMVHAQMMVEGYWYESHGMLFQKRVRELSRIVGFEIPVTDAISPTELASSASGKPYVILVVGDPHGTFTYGAMMANWKTKVPELQDALRRRFGGSDDISAYFVPSSKLTAHMKLARVFPPDMYRPVKFRDEIVGDIKSGQHLFTINPQKERDAFFK